MFDLPTPIPLRLFDRSYPGKVSKKTTLLITLATSESHTIEMYITNLDQGYTMVLGYDWLVQHNLIIDWAETKVMFPLPTTPVQNPPSGETPQ